MKSSLLKFYENNNTWVKLNLLAYLVLIFFVLLNGLSELLFHTSENFYYFPWIEATIKALYFILFFCLVLVFYVYVLYKVYLSYLFRKIRNILLPLTRFEKFWLYLYIATFQYINLVIFVSLNPNIKQYGFMISEAGMIVLFISIVGFPILSLSVILNFLSIIVNFFDGKFKRAFLFAFVPFLAILPFLVYKSIEEYLITLIWVILNNLFL